MRRAVGKKAGRAEVHKRMPAPPVQLMPHTRHSCPHLVSFCQYMQEALMHQASIPCLLQQRQMLLVCALLALTHLVNVSIMIAGMLQLVWLTAIRKLARIANCDLTLA